MPLFKYRYIAERGKEAQGVLSADSLLEAKESLRLQQLLVVDIELFSEKSATLKLSVPQLIDFTRMVGQLLQAGIPLYEALVIVEEKHARHRSHPLFVDLCEKLKIGVTFSDAVANYPHIFDPIYVAMVKAGEQTASLALCFDELCTLLERQQNLKKQLVSAAAYPLFLGAFCGAVLLALLLFVIPSMKILFEGRQLHPITHVVFYASDFALNYGVTVAGVVGLLICGIVYALYRPALRTKIDAALLTLPVVGRLVQESAVVRFCRTASLLLSGGVSILQTLRLSRSVMKNQILEQLIEKAEKSVSEGNSLSGELSHSPHIPSIVHRMLSIGEETGKTAFMLQSIANICQSDLEKQLRKIVTVLQPTLLLLLGVIVGVVLLSILIPLTDVGSAF